MPGARCARSLVCEMIKAHKHSHHGHTGNTRHSPRNGVNSLYRALPGDRAFLPPSPRGTPQQGLISASGYQDHTTSPYAAALSSGPIIIKPDAAASIASRAQRVVTIAIRPSVGHETAGVLKLICPTAKAENFCEGGWTLLEVRQNAEVICPSGTIGTRSPHERSDMRVEKNKSRISLHSSGLYSLNMCSNAMGFASAQPILRAAGATCFSGDTDGR